jgi:acyl-[acyl-carrier-protein]-phospholipid O-acyltransferase/long-chain-fatty-acid--[acyl-carrier-protein] ligase
MTSNQLYLFKDRRFLPIFIVQFCGCLNDSIIKNALIMLITYKLAGTLDQPTTILVLLTNTIFTLPFALFASISGQLADKYERSTIIKIIKFFEILIVCLSLYGFVQESLAVLFTVVGLMGTHSTFFGPIKYSVLPDHLKKEELLGANGFIEAGTFISILIGTLLGGFYTFSNVIILGLAVIVSILGFVFSHFVPRSNNYNPDVNVSLNIVRDTIEMIKYASSKKQVYLAILGISWFWFIGAAILAQMPSLAKETLGADENVANLFIATFSIGVGFGSYWCSRLFNNEITTKYVFLAALGISIVSIDLFFATRISSVSYEPEHLKSVFVFLSKKHNWRIVIDLFLLSSVGGLYVVPLFAVMQYFSSPVYRSRIIAANNFINSVFMAGSTVILSFLFSWGYSIPFVILFVSILNMVVACYIYGLVPEAKELPLKIIKKVAKLLCDLVYTVEVKGIENFHKAGKRSVIVANHISYIDPALLALYLPEDITFAIHAGVAEEAWVRPFLKFSKTFGVEANNPSSVKSLIDEVKKNKKIAIFPEGRVSVTGALMKIYEGPGMIADKADATILPIRIDGPQFTHFSKLKNIFKRKIFQKVTITILPPVKFTPPEGSDNRQRRKYISQALYDLMADMLFESSDYKKTLYEGLVDAARLYGFNTQIMQDIDQNRVSYRSLLLKSFLLGDLISKRTDEGEYVGVMLPNMVGSVIVFYAMQAFGRVPAMINFTAGARNIISGCNTAMVRTIYTSKKFVEKAELQDVVERIIGAGIKVIYLENLRKKINIFTKIKAIIGSIFPQYYYKNICENRNDQKPAVILFTSGTEGVPKAVALSHRNIVSNKCQAIAKLEFNQHDKSFNALPMFHSFGLTGMIISSLSGVRTFFYPSPLHYKIIPEAIYDFAPSIMFGTDTFFNGYAKHAHPYDFYSLRHVFAGAEKLKSSTRQLWLDKFGVRIFEGYGVTETAPVLAVNTAMHDRPGTVGRFLPKIQYSIIPVEGIQEGGRLCVKGPNIMLGYIHPDRPGQIVPPKVEKLGDGWYDTGDIVKVDEDGYITILGRAKRFAKIAGEMVSLSAVEELVNKIDPENISAAVCIEDERKGEKIILFTSSAIVNRDSVAAAIKTAGASELYIPKNIVELPQIPVLATGKTDYRKLVEMAYTYDG